MPKCHCCGRFVRVRRGFHENHSSCGLTDRTPPFRQRRVLVQDSCDILNRAHRYAKDRESTQRRDRK
jgi:hypothetical protein